MSFLRPGAAILEIGSAFGRDANYLESFGFMVDRTDATQGFVDLLCKNGYSARLFNILTDQFDETYDLIFANAVFLHFQPSEMAEVLAKIHQSLKRNGILSFSVKYGEGEEWSTEKVGLPRYYCYWNEEKIRALLVKQGYEILFLSCDETWLQIIARPIEELSFS
ncbi:MAG: class I SAM-dependent methyltransferase [Candidatus Babeliales bacterium]